MSVKRREEEKTKDNHLRQGYGGQRKAQDKSENKEKGERKKEKGDRLPIAIGKATGRSKINEKTENAKR